MADEQHRHRCEVRQVLAWRAQHGGEWVNRWLYGHQPDGRRRVKGVVDYRGRDAVDALVADCRAQWAAGNRGEAGAWA